MKKFLFILGILLLSVKVQAQVVTGPTTALFAQPATDIPLTLSYQLDFFQCASISAPTATPPNACVGQAATPFQSGAVIPVASVTTQTPDANGDNRTFPLSTAPASDLLGAIPVGIPFVATLIVNGNPAQGEGNSARSAASNPFFSATKPAGAVTTVKVQ